MWRLALAAGLALLSSSAVWAQAAADKPKLVVMPLQTNDLDASSVATLDELLADGVRRLGKHQVVGKSDLEAMLGLENMKDQLGCDDVACAAQIGGALGVELLLAGRVARLGDSLIVVLKLIDTQHQQVLASAKHKVADDENLYDQAIEQASRQLFGLAEEPARAFTEPAPVTPEVPAHDGLGWFGSPLAGIGYRLYVDNDSPAAFVQLGASAGYALASGLSLGGRFAYQKGWEGSYDQVLALFQLDGLTRSRWSLSPLFLLGLTIPGGEQPGGAAVNPEGKVGFAGGSGVTARWRPLEWLTLGVAAEITAAPPLGIDDGNFSTCGSLLVDVHAPTAIDSGPLISAPWYAWGIDLLVGGALLVTSQLLQRGDVDVPSSSDGSQLAGP